MHRLEISSEEIWKSYETDEAISEEVNLEEEEEEEEEEEDKEARPGVYRPWCDLTVHLFQIVLSHLSVEDVGRLFMVCKTWSSTSDLFADVQTWPWLMYREKPDGTYKILNPLRSTQRSLKIDELSLDENEFVVTICAKDGWIVLLLDDCVLLMINPFSPNTRRAVPPLLDTGVFYCITFSSVPTSPDCIVFGITSISKGESVEIILWSPKTGDEKWDKVKFENGCVFHPVRSNPVFFNGKFYCLGQCGFLGVFNPIDRTWKILDALDPFCGNGDYSGTNCYLLESQGDLICVHKNSDANAKISIFKLDQTKMAWSKLEDIGETTIFLDPRGSLAKILPDKSYSNKIFTKAFDPSNVCALYCMKSHMYNTELYGLKEPMDCVWLEPNLRN
ncbi:hypothetical protein LUZ60_010205 [Juncus effusus]|nr:hypothetical protein LUZ60_010205 [Juncus effusus]